MEKKIYNLIILDESGSMQSIKPQAISGMNETLQTIKSAQEMYEDQNHYVSLVSFNTNRVKTIYDCCPAHRTKTINNEDYQPNACTPLYDAMGISLTKLKTKVSDEDNVLVTIITDGYENASREYSGKSIAQLVEELKTIGWTFTYIGANQDVEKVASSMGIRNSFTFEADARGTSEMFKRENASRSEYYCCIGASRKLKHREPLIEQNQDKEKKNDATKLSEEKTVQKEKKKNKWWWF